MTDVSMRQWRHWTWISIAVYFCVILALALSRHWGYMSSLNDLGVFDQAVWGTLHGGFLPNSSNPLGVPINWLGFHFHCILLLFVPLYAISPSTEWFALAQSAALSLSAWPVFLMASRICASEKTGFFWTLAYLANPFLLNAAAWDFHPITLAVPFIAAGLLAIEKSDRRMLLLCCMPLLLIQEHMGLTVAGFGLLWRLRNKTWLTAAGLVCIGMAHAILVMGFIMPALSPLGGHLMLSANLGQLSRYHWLGSSFGEMLQNLLLHPFAIARALIFQTDDVSYLALLLAPLLGFPLAAPGFLIPALPDLAAGMLSSNSMPRSVFSYHSASLIPIFTMAAIHGGQRISLRTKKFSLNELSGLSLAAMLAGGYALAPIPLPGARNLWAANDTFNLPDPELIRVADAIGDKRSLSVQTNVGPHFSQRKEVYPYPGKIGQVDAIALRLASPTRNLDPPDPWFNGTLAWHLQMRPDDFLQSIECLLQGREYGVLLWDDPWLVLAKNTASPALGEQVRHRIEALYQEWHAAPVNLQARTFSPCGKEQAHSSQTPITVR